MALDSTIRKLGWLRIGLLFNLALGWVANEGPARSECRGVYSQMCTPDTEPGGGGNYVPDVYYPSPKEIANSRAVKLNDQGVIAYNRRDYREAIRLFELALRAGPNKALANIRRNLGNAYNNLGVEFANKGDWEEALRWYLVGRKYTPEKANANNIAQAQARIDSIARAAEERRAAEIAAAEQQRAAEVAAQEAARKEVQRQADLAAAQQRTSELLANLRENLQKQTLDGSSTSLGAGFDFIVGTGEQAKAAPVQGPADTSVVDARGPIGSLPPGLPQLAEVENSPGREAWLRGMDAVVKHDWELAAAWFGTAKLRDPTNQAIANATALAKWTKDHRINAPAGTATLSKTAGSAPERALQVPQSSDLEFLLPNSDASSAAQQATNSSGLEPTDADRELLRPGMEEMIREMIDSLTPEELARLRTPLSSEERARLLAAPTAADEELLKKIWPPVGDKKPDANAPAETGLAPGATMPPAGQ